MSWEDYSRFKKWMLDRGFPEWRFDDYNRDIKYSDDVFEAEKIKDEMYWEAKEKMTREELAEFVHLWVEENIEPEYDEDGEPFWYDETYEYWERIFEYDVIASSYVSFEIDNELGLLD